MKLKMSVLSVVPNSRIATKGENAGKPQYSVDIYCHAGDFIPLKFVIWGVPTVEAMADFVGRFPTHSTVEIDYQPREQIWLTGLESVKLVNSK